MKVQHIDIAGYWEVIICYNVWLGELNSGFTHTDFKRKLSIVGVGIGESKEQCFNTLIHELKHVQSHICKYYGVPEDSEQAAYLIGYIAQQVHKNINLFE